MEEMRRTYKILIGKPRHRWEDNIKMDLLNKQVVKVQTGFNRYQIGSSSGILRTW
jgi:hypothetical protein